MQSHLNRTGAIGSPPREGDARVFGQAPADRVGNDDWNVLIAQAGIYGILNFNFFDDHLVIQPGIRAEPYITRPSRATPRAADTPDIGAQRFDLAIEPRLSASLMIVPQLSAPRIGRPLSPSALRNRKISRRCSARRRSVRRARCTT